MPGLHGVHASLFPFCHQAGQAVPGNIQAQRMRDHRQSTGFMDRPDGSDQFNPRIGFKKGFARGQVFLEGALPVFDLADAHQIIGEMGAGDYFPMGKIPDGINRC